MTAKKEPTEGQHAYEGLDRIIHERARLGILTSLITRPDGVLFGELKQQCSLTDGNLNRHLVVLEEAGLVEVSKRFEGKRPQTTCRLTRKGRRQFLAYLAELERVLHDALPEGEAKPGEKGLAWSYT
jgi:DNA-binding transcriptional ArsR family regulator